MMNYFGNYYLKKFQLGGIINTIKERLYNNISPSGYYNPIKRVWNAVINNTPEKFDNEIDGLTGRQLLQNSKEDLAKYLAHDPYSDNFMNKNLENDLRNALWAKYLGLTDELVGFKISDYIEESPYKPPHAKDGEVYYRFNPKLVQVLNDLKLVDLAPNKITKKNPHKQSGIIGWFLPDYVTEEVYPKNEFGGDVTTMKAGDIPVGYKGIAKGWGMGSYTVGTGLDDSGEYSSYYDEWDINPYKGGSAQTNIPFISNIGDISVIGTPIKLYDRKYK